MPKSEAFRRAKSIDLPEVAPCQGGILEDSILLTLGQPASYAAGIRGKPLGGFPPNPLSLVLTSDGTDVTFSSSADADVRVLTSADADVYCRVN